MVKKGRGGGSRTGHSRYRAQRAKLKARLRRDGGGDCCYCGHPIDLDLEYPDPWSFSADHSHPVGRGGANYGVGVVLRPCHLRCNLRAGDRWGTQEDGAMPTVQEVTVRVTKSLNRDKSSEVQDT